MPANNREKPVLVVGATGAVGSKVVAHLLERARTVRALVRPGSDASHIEGPGVTIARGDMMDPPSLLSAMDGVDAVITSAAGYTKRRKSDSDDTDTVGNRNLVDAAKTAGVRRFVLTGILTAEKTPQVPHFWHKKLVEDYLIERGVPYISLRPGAFLDQSVDFFAERVRKGRLIGMGTGQASVTWVYTDDLARYLAEAVDLPDRANGLHIDIGWDRPLSMSDLQKTLSEQLGQPLKMTSLPWWFMSGALRVAGLFSAAARDIRAMIAYMRTGQYVADTSLQAEYFDVPSAEDALGRWLDAKNLRAASEATPVAV